MRVAVAPDTNVQLWIAPESLADDPDVAARIGAWLTDDERERQSRFGAAGPRRLDLVARGLSRAVLSRLEPGIAPRDWRFVRRSGRPSLAPPFDATGLHFNLAHTDGLVVLAAGRIAQVGVDVEALAKPVRLDIAKRYFSATEAAALAALPPGERAVRFLRLWTLKEAYLKATGQGVSGGLDTAIFDFDGELPVFRQADGAPRWTFREFRPPGYLAALAQPAPSVTSALPVTWREWSAADF
jgi:4'-phosphopantetheinyl transferase